MLPKIKIKQGYPSHHDHHHHEKDDHRLGATIEISIITITITIMTRMIIGRVGLLKSPPSSFHDRPVRIFDICCRHSPWDFFCNVQNFSREEILDVQKF